jgi:phospholipid-translocating ATPase
MAISQFFNELKVGFLFSYIAPLAFVLFVTLLKEGTDDFFRYKRDQETNNTKYNKLTFEGKKKILSKDIKIGDMLEIHQNEKVPADMIILKSFGNDTSQGVFIRTDQLDGETDWKLRKAPPSTQKHETTHELLMKNFFIIADAPDKKIYDFNGVLVYFEKNEDVNLSKFSVFFYYRIILI